MGYFYKKLCKVETLLAITCLLITVFTLTIAALMRSFGTPINWALDIALLSFAWCTFLGASIAFREGEFVEVDFIFNKLPLTIQRIIETIVYLLIFAFLCSLIYFGTVLSVVTWNRSFQGIPALSYTWVTLCIPVTSFLMVITLIIKFYRRFRGENAFN